MHGFEYGECRSKTNPAVRLCRGAAMTQAAPALTPRAAGDTPAGMNVLVFGATGGTGRAVIAAALAAGHGVTAFVRRPGALPETHGLRVMVGDVRESEAVARTVPGHDAIVITLGNPSRAALPALLRPRDAPPCDACAVGTRHVLDAIPQGERPRIAVVSAFGVGETRTQAPWFYRVFFALFLGAQFADKEVQEQLLRESGADFVLFHPVGLTDKPETGARFVSTTGAIRGHALSRADLAAVIVAELEGWQHHGATLSVSG